jgi:hypothetical protein
MSGGMEGCRLRNAAKGRVNAVPGGVGKDEDELAPGVEADGHEAVVLRLEVFDALQFGRPPESPLVICPAPTHSQSCSVHFRNHIIRQYVAAMNVQVLLWIPM